MPLDWIVITVVPALIACLYYPVINYGLVVDDLPWRERMREGWLDWDRRPGPIGKLRTAWLRLYGGGILGRNTSVKLDHAISIFIHLLISISIYYAFGRSMASAWGSVLYAVHPSALHLAAWLNGRRYALAVLCGLIAVWLVQAGQEGGGGLFLMGGIIIYIVGVCFQPISLPAVILLPPLTLVPVFLMAPILYQGHRDKYVMRLLTILDRRRAYIGVRSFPAYVKVAGWNLRRVFMPGVSFMIYRCLLGWGCTKAGNEEAYKRDGSFWGNLLLLAGFGGYVGWLLMTGEVWMGRVGLAILGVCVMYSGWCPVIQWATDRYMGFGVAMGGVFIAHTVLRGMGVELGSAVLMGYLGMQVVYFLESRGMFREIEAFDRHHIDRQKWNCRVFEPVGAKKLKGGDVFGAWEVAREGLRYSPEDMKLNMLAANCMYHLKERPMVIEYMRRAWAFRNIGCEFIVKDMERRIFGADLDEEKGRIERKESKLDRKGREAVLKLHGVIRGGKAGGG